MLALSKTPADGPDYRLRLFSYRNRPVHLGPYPLERLSRSQTPPDLAAVPPLPAPDFEPADPLQRTRVSFVGSAATVHAQLQEFVERTGADEVMITSHIYDHAARLRSYEIVAPVAVTA